MMRYGRSLLLSDCDCTDLKHVVVLEVMELE